MLTDEQLAQYDELGFLGPVRVLSEEEAGHYRAEVERTCRALGGRVTRIDLSHAFFRWAWELSTHPRLLDCLERLLGPDIVIRSSRVFYKHGRSSSFVGWHQDGITEKLEDGRAPAVWLALTAATVENGCLRVVPRSHRLGLVPHAGRPDADNLTTLGLTAQARVDSPHDLVMRPGEMSLHHPLAVHGSNPNRSEGPRIGFSATYASASLRGSRRPVAWARGDGPRDGFELIGEPPAAPIEAAAAAYLARDNQILFANPY